MMTHRERIFAAADRAAVDRVPTLGGWITSAAHYQEIVGIGEDEFWSDPESAAIEAFDRLGVDGLVSVFIPPSQERYRGMDIHDVERRQAGYPDPEAVRDYIRENTRDFGTLERDFDGDAYREQYAEERREK